jgi:8-oxo-dGTP pyrophosphatase MutT (NUDIX family)
MLKLALCDRLNNTMDIAFKFPKDDQRTALLNLLINYKANSAQEETAKQEIISFVLNNQQCFSRELTAGHITGSSWLLNAQEDAALLMHHRKLGRWLQLGGHCDGESDVLAVALREAQEESGVNNIIPISKEIFDIDVHLIPENSKEAAHYHYDIRYLLKVNSNENILLNDEANALLWVKKDGSNLPEVDESVRRMFDKWRKSNNLTPLANNLTKINYF